MDPIPTPSASRGAQPFAKGVEAPKKDEGQINIKVPPQGALTSKNAALNTNAALKPDRNIKVDLNIHGDAPSATKPILMPKEQPKRDVPPPIKEAAKPPVKPTSAPSQQISQTVSPINEPPKPAYQSGLINPAITEAPKLNYQSNVSGVQKNDIPNPDNSARNSYKLAATEVQGPKGPLVENNGKKLFFAMAAIAIIGVLAIGGYFLMNKDNVSPSPLVVSPTSTPAPTIDPSLDSDSDGIPDKVEKAIGSNPDKMDTDGDSYNDLPEIKNGYSPIIAGSDGKYTPEQFQTLKDKIKSADEKFYKKIFEVENEAVSDIEDFSSPDATFKVYISALETKNLDLYRKTLDKESLKKIDQDPFYSASKDVSKWDTAQIAMWKNAKYKISEQTAKYAVMVPEFREQTASAPGVTPVETISMSDMYFRYEDNLWKIDFVVTLQDMISRTIARAGAIASGSDINLAEEGAVKQLKEGWKASFK